MRVAAATPKDNTPENPAGISALKDELQTLEIDATTLKACPAADRGVVANERGHPAAAAFVTYGGKTVGVLVGECVGRWWRARLHPHPTTKAAIVTTPQVWPLRPPFCACR